MTTTSADLPTWTGPAWATWQTEAIGGIRWVRRATTAVTEYPDPDAPGRPVTVEVAAFDFVDGVEGPEATANTHRVLVERQSVQFLVGSRQFAFDLDGARDLIAALSERVMVSSSTSTSGPPRGSVTGTVVPVGPWF